MSAPLLIFVIWMLLIAFLIVAMTDPIEPKPKNRQKPKSVQKKPPDAFPW